MMRITKAILEIAAVLAILGIVAIGGYTYVIAPVIDSFSNSDNGNGNGNGNDGNNGNELSDFSFPELNTRLYSESWFNTNYPAPEGYVWVLNSDNEGRLPTKEWLADVWEMSQDYDEGSKVSKSEQRNEFMRAAMRDRDIAFLEKEGDNTDGVDFITVFDDDGTTRVKKFDESLVTVDMDKTNDMEKVFVPSKAENLLDKYSQKLEERDSMVQNLTKEVKDLKASLASSPAPAAEEVATAAAETTAKTGSYTGISRRSSSPVPTSTNNNGGSYPGISRRG